MCARELTRRRGPPRSRAPSSAVLGSVALRLRVGTFSSSVPAIEQQSFGSWRFTDPEFRSITKMGCWAETKPPRLRRTLTSRPQLSARRGRDANARDLVPSRSVAVAAVARLARGEESARASSGRVVAKSRFVSRTRKRHPRRASCSRGGEDAEAFVSERRPVGDAEAGDDDRRQHPSPAPRRVEVRYGAHHVRGVRVFPRVEGSLRRGQGGFPTPPALPHAVAGFAGHDVPGVLRRRAAVQRLDRRALREQDGRDRGARGHGGCARRARARSARGGSAFSRAPRTRRGRRASRCTCRSWRSTARCRA